MTFDKLLNGGYIIYFRHAEATSGKDAQNVNFKDCSTQRNLTEKGKEQAIMIGNVLRQNGIPIEPSVISSPFCRAVDTAKLAFPNKMIRIDYSLAEIVPLSEEPKMTAAKRKQIIYEINRLFELPTQTGKNRVIIGHSFPKDIVLGDVPYSTGTIIQPKGWKNGYDVIGQLNINELD
ncbi:histidine phosphatase family protein [Solibacillus sp. CAU 1738]|uniref:histidine phosphatase family protein n=1 Tax=Solibacillus sp. CAU 1738 TaxID=3140363 RepID=UPI0032617A46